jgi:uncharacterized membrane protein YsdA (DUF1294 family)/cold shock CspA family protein
MRYQGKLVEWNDDKAFGFVLPNAGGRKIFVHLNEFQNRASSRRPSVGDLLTFEIGLDAQKRSCAIKISPVVAPQKRRQIEARNESREIASTWSHWLATAWIIAMFALFAFAKFPWKFAAAWIAVNVVTYALYAIDKSSAERGTWRISEKNLHLFALIGGWPAAAIAQQRLRHKTSKAEFRTVFWLTVVVNIVAMVWLATRGAGYLANVFV